MKHITLVMLVLLSATAVTAIPPIASEFYGTVSINGQLAPAGTNVSAFDADGHLCGTFILKKPGEYGFLSCNGDDPDTSHDEGAVSGEQVIFRVDGKRAKQTTDTPWVQGGFTEVHLDTGVGIAYLESPASVGGFNLFLIVIAFLTGAGSLSLFIIRFIRHHKK